MKNIILLLAAALLCHLSLSAQKVDGGQYLFILDGSGSMWQKIGPEYKIAVAKSVLSKLVNQLPDQSSVGLIAYGHTQKGDCADIQTLVPLGKLDRTAFNARLEGVNPIGMTPIARSVAHGLEVVRNTEGPVTLILVSDGLETCEGNACDLVAKARQAGVTVTVHVVGFGMEGKDWSALECIAQAGGGQYFPANNAAELTAALQKTVEEPVKNGGFLSVKVTEQGKLVDATVRVFKKGADKEIAFGRTYAGKETNPRVLLLAAGAYEAEVQAITLDGNLTQRLMDLNIRENDTLRREVDFENGTFEILVTRNGALSDALVKLYKAGAKEVVTQTRSYTNKAHNPAKLQVTPGVYDIEIASVEIDNKPSVKLYNQTLDGGTVSALSHAFKSGDLKVGARQAAGLLDATVSIVSVQNGREKEVARGRTYQKDETNPKTFVLEPGVYEVRLNVVRPSGMGKKTLSATVVEGQVVKVEGVW